MKRKYVIIFIIINLSLIFSFPLVTLTKANLILQTKDYEVDPVDDRVAINIGAKTWNPTNLHPELEVQSMGRKLFSWNYTITFNNTILTGAGYYYSLGLYDLFEDGYIYTIMLYPGFDGYLIGPDGYWNSTGWEDNILKAVSVVNISGNEFDINIPTAAHNWSFPHNWAFSAIYNNSLIDPIYIYLDVCPNVIQDIILEEFTGSPQSPLIWPFIVIPVLIGISIIITIIIVYRYKKK